ncbi:MAG: hypothetical protein HY758_02685 [Nitrospirae bacterium]|nr:hypothetical protein [Nitrospirota bacterium]
MSIFFPQPLYPSDIDPGLLSLAIFPFNDIASESLDMRMPAVLKAELSRYEFIKIIPVETVKEKIYEIEPSLMWAEKKGGEKRGGILWKMEPKIIHKVRRALSADYSLFGDLTRFNKKWRMDAYIIEESDPAPVMSFTFSGTSDEDLPDRLAELARKTADWLGRKHSLHEAEEYIRSYLGGIYTLSSTVQGLEKLVSLDSGSIPLNGLLLDLYSRDEGRYQEEIIRTGLNIVSQYDSAAESDRRYLLSLSMDPFDIISRTYEARQDWKNAIDMRGRALKTYAFRMSHHRAALGRDHYFFAVSLGENGEKTKALEHYDKALVYLPSSSDEYQMAKERRDKLTQKMQ